MTFERAMLILIVVLLFVTILLSISGCSLVQQAMDIVSKPNVENTTTPETSTNQLWQTVKKSNWLVTVSILGIGAGAFAFLNGSKIGLPAIGASCVSLFMALAVARFAFWMAVFGMIGSLSAVIISILIKNRGLKELVYNVQDIKQTAKDNNIDLVFQDKIKGILLKQVKSTKKLVRKIKAKV